MSRTRTCRSTSLASHVLWVGCGRTVTATVSAPRSRLITRIEARKARLEGTTPGAPREIDFLIAKFPEHSDDIDVIRWERVTLLLAEEAGIDTCESRLEAVGDSTVLLVRRFDRQGHARVPFLSAMSLLDAADGEPRSYVELFDALRQIGSTPASDGPQLWRRLAFNILVSSFDDHLRNHAVLSDGRGWRLTPAYDLNPVPAHVTPRELSTTINVDGDPTASIELAIEAAPEFMLKQDDARAIASDIARVTATWRQRAAALAISGRDIEWMSSAFEHDDVRLARGWS